MTDKITNWYLKIDKKNQDVPTTEKDFKNHGILPNSRIAMIGGSGAGKSNALMEFLQRKNGAFYEIIIFTSNPDEPLLKQLKEDIPAVKIITDIDEMPLPNQTEMPEAKYQKLCVWDDFITLTKKQMKNPEQWAIAGRKFGWTTIFMAQNYTSLPKVILRQIEYFILYRLNDLTTISNIIRNHNIENIDKQVFIDAYIGATRSKGNFFMVDLKNEDPKYRFRQNFINYLYLLR